MKFLLAVSALAALALAAPAPEADAADQGGYKPTPAPPRCGGFRIGGPLECPAGKGYVCVEDPKTQGCADCTGVCVKPRRCGGLKGTACPKGQTCVDDPRDDCDPRSGGADCIGLCAPGTKPKA